ncbi:MAG: hypothetical protein KGV51_02900 [Moraxellaceae bacterium]|nr:hypothetical protein [Moraxellaceae bacterium]
MRLIIGLLLILAGIGVCILSISLLIAWWGICFGTVIIGIILLLFLPQILLLPLYLFPVGVGLIGLGIASIKGEPLE